MDPEGPGSLASLASPGEGLEQSWRGKSQPDGIKKFLFSMTL